MPEPPGARGEAAGRYLDTIAELLARARSANDDAIVGAAGVVARTVAADGIIRLFGSGHSHLLALEAAGRAGGFAGVDVLIDPGMGRAETLEGYGSILVREQLWEARDCLFVISHSGRNPAPIEVALAGRGAGLTTIALTALDYSRASASRHSSGRRLFEVCDLVLDTVGVPGDAAVALPGAPVPTGATSTVVGAALLDAVLVEAVAELVRMGVEPPLVRSYNLDGSEAHNAAMFGRYRGRVTRAI
jgi:uncharacterized phosphosugar-binding protein